MADHSGNWYPIGPVLWDPTGNPYRATSDGQKSYIPPIVAAQERNDPKLIAWAHAHGANITYGPNDPNGNPTTSDVRTGAPGGGFSGNYHWNADTGGYEKDNFFDSSLGGLVLGASAVAAPFAASALAGGAGAGAGTGAAEGSGLLASTPIDAGLFTAPTVASSGAVDAALAGATGGAAGGAAGSASAATDLLPSTATVPNTGALAPATTSSLTTAPDGGAGLTDWLTRAQDVGDSLSGLSYGRAEGRNAEGMANQNQNRAAVDLYNTELNAPRTIARNAVKGDVLANAQDVHIDRPSTIPDFTISGGLRPSMFSDATRQTGRNISTAAANTPIPTPTPPVLPPLPQANGFDHTLNVASTISGLSRAVPPDYWGKIAGGLKGLFT